MGGLGYLEVLEDGAYKGPIDKFIPEDMKDEIRELNDSFYKIFDDLNEARPTLYGEAYPVIGAQILNEYCTEYYLLKLKCQIEEAQEFFADLAERIGVDMTTIEEGAESAQAAQENGENEEAEQTDGKTEQSAEGAPKSVEEEQKQAAETAADKLMKEYRNKTKKKKTEKGAGNGNAGTGECT